MDTVLIVSDEEDFMQCGYGPPGVDKKYIICEPCNVRYEMFYNYGRNADGDYSDDMITFPCDYCKHTLNKNEYPEKIIVKKKKSNFSEASNREVIRKNN